MRWPKIAPNWQLPIGLMKSLTPIFLFGGIGLAVGSLIAISITSSILAISIMQLWRLKGPLLPLGPTFIALGVEVLILVISIAMYWFASLWAGGWWIH
jgi:hypothetical protein